MDALRAAGLTRGAIFKLKEHFKLRLEASSINDDEKDDKSVSVVEYASKSCKYTFDQLLENETVDAQGINKSATGKVQGPACKTAKARAGGPAKVIRKTASELERLGMIKFDEVKSKKEERGGDKHENVTFSFTDPDLLVASVTGQNESEFADLVNK